MPEEKMVGKDLKQLAVQKECEWKEIQQLRLQTLETSLEQKEQELEDEKNRFNKLKEDFKYNLKLLNERHGELDNYDKLIAKLRTSLSVKDGELSDIKIRIDELEIGARRDGTSREEMACHYQQRLREKQAELNTYRTAKDAEVREERERLEASRKTTDRRILSLEEELAAQKQELNHGFEEAMRQREYEFRKQVDEINRTSLENELKAKLLTKELEVVRSASDKTTAKASEASTHQRELEKKLKHAEWELHDVNAMRDAQILELKDKLNQAESGTKRLQEDFTRKHSNLDRVLREKDSCLSKVKEASYETERVLSSRVRELEGGIEEVQLKVKQVEWTMEDMRKDKDSLIQKLQLELADTKAKFESRLVETSKDTTSQDLEIRKLKESENKLKTEVSQRKADIERYKHELAIALERQSDLERAKVQLELDWTHRYEDVERQQYERSEELVKGLTLARDEAQAELTQKCRELEHCKQFIKTLTEDRNKAITTLRKHGLTLDHSIQSEEPTRHNDEDLKVQNENLREVIRQMRKDMETLGEGMPTKLHTTKDRKEPNLVANEYVKNLEKEIQDLKAKMRKAEHDAKEGDNGANPEADVEAVLVAAGDNMVVRTHVETLNNTIGTLRNEKTELMAQLRKQQTRIAHLEAGISQLSKQPLQKQATIEQLQYELSSQQRRHQVEVAGLKGRVADLDLQLAETHKEADEYYKATIERNLEMTGLGNEISKLKMALAEKRPAVNYGAQELIIQQLHDEIERIHQGSHTHSEPFNMKGPGRWAEPVGGNHELKAKLKQAVQRISQLAREKKQLIEMGNRLRAQLYKAGVQSDGQSHPSYLPVGPVSYIPAGPHPPPSGHTFTTDSSSPQGDVSSTNFYTTTGESGSSRLQSGDRLTEKMKNKLIELERLHYEATTKKLASEQQDRLMSTGDPDVVSGSSGSVSLGSLQFGDDDDAETGVVNGNDSSLVSILKKPMADPPVKLSPVPEDQVPTSCGHTMPSNIPRPDSALSDSFQQTASQSWRPGPAMLSMSSVGGDSLADVWKLLDDDGISPRPFTPLHSSEGPFRGLQYPGDAYDRSGSSQSFTVRGSQPPLQQRPQVELKAAVNKPITPRKPAGKKAGPRPKIRNYNLRDS